MASGDVLWVCKQGHFTLASPALTGVWCPAEGHPSSNAMKPRDLFPSWGPAEPPEGIGRRCCRSYPTEAHRDGCRHAVVPVEA